MKIKQDYSEPEITSNPRALLSGITEVIIYIASAFMLALVIYGWWTA